MNKRLLFLFLIFLCFALYLNSALWFRLKLVVFFNHNQQFSKSIQIYNKILRKNNIRPNLSKDNFAKISLDLGNLYAKLFFTNKAIVSYARAGKTYPEIEVNNYYIKNDLQKDKSLVIGLIESGLWDKAGAEFRNLIRQYPNFQDANKFINTTISLKDKNISFNNKNLLFYIGDAYIENQLFDEAREFFTNRILDYGISPLEVLGYLRNKYSSDAETKQKVWGNEFYVTLEDFEKIKPQLSNWIGNKKARENSHNITEQFAFRGSHSEYLNISYSEERRTVLGDHEFWFKATQIPLSNKSFNLGIRFYVYTREPFIYNIAFNVLYPKGETSGIFSNEGDSRDMGNGWREYRIEDLFAKAKWMASKKNWDFDEMIIDKIMFNSTGYTDKLHIDEIQLFVMN